MRLVAVGAMAACLLAAPAAAQAPDRTITVSGAASTTVPNDLARFVFAVTTRRATASAALRATSTRIRRVIAAVDAQGVQRRDVVTRTVTVSRTTRPLRPGSRIRVVEYVATNRVLVTVREIARSGAVVDAAVAAGATGVGGPTLEPSNAREVYKSTLVAAFAETRDKARRLAAEAGVTLGAPVTIRESGGSPPPVLSVPTVPNALHRTRARARPPVRPGTTTVRARVTAVFAIS
jgi:uncharacterized protein YggE